VLRHHPKGKQDFESTDLSAKMKALLNIAGKVQKVQQRSNDRRCRPGAARRRHRQGNSRHRADRRGLLHVQSLRGWAGHPAAEDPVMYREIGKQTAQLGYVGPD
jgi:hypothetical protein